MYYNTMIDYRTYLETVVLDSLAEQEKLSLTQEELEFHKHTLNEGILRALFKAGKINIPQEELDSIEKSIIIESKSGRLRNSQDIKNCIEKATYSIDNNAINLQAQYNTEKKADFNVLAGLDGSGKSVQEGILLSSVWYHDNKGTPQRIIGMNETSGESKSDNIERKNYEKAYDRRNPRVVLKRRALISLMSIDSNYKLFGKEKSIVQVRSLIYDYLVKYLREDAEMDPSLRGKEQLNKLKNLEEPAVYLSVIHCIQREGLSKTYVLPDNIIEIRVKPEEAYRRAVARAERTGEELTKFENLNYLKRSGKSYELLGKVVAKWLKVVDGNMNPIEISDRIVEIMNEHSKRTYYVDKAKREEYLRKQKLM
ncbi:MAG: hypothetical protein QT09_C0017G0004 [archaeon GW2011_AR18]|nr:MAG: hypothetical protein QT09_C0017G0004 [archaeon GW2011_AR18]